MATQSQPGDSRFVTALFRSPDAAERAYRAACRTYTASI